MQAPAGPYRRLGRRRPGAGRGRCCRQVRVLHVGRHGAGAHAAADTAASKDALGVVHVLGRGEGGVGRAQHACSPPLLPFSESSCVVGGSMRWGGVCWWRGGAAWGGRGTERHLRAASRLAALLGCDVCSSQAESS